jgi:Glycosyl transferases group 1
VSDESPLRLTVSLADQRFDQTKSIGIFNVSLGLCRALAQRPELQRLTLLANDSLPLEPDLDRIILQRCAGKNAGKLWRIWWDQFGVYCAARQTQNDWLLLPKGYASFFKRCPVNLATYIHDTILEFIQEFYPREASVENVYFRAGLRASLAQSQIIFTNSHFTAGQIASFAKRHRLRVPRIEVAGIGFDHLPRPSLATRTGIMILASRWPHKRTDLAVDYLSRWQKERQFEGRVDWVGQLPGGLIFPKNGNWHLHSRLDTDEFNHLFAQARVSIYFSEYEGFGMPPVEATIVGACPVFSDLPSTREVMRDAGFRFTNNAYETFALAMDRALKTSTQQVDEWAEQLLIKYNWKSVAEKMVKALQSSTELA